MKKLMFNEHYGLETATLTGSKTRTSIILKLPQSFKGTYVCGFHKYTNKQGEWFTSLYDEDEIDIDNSSIPYRYSEGEIVAIAQSYEDAENVIVKKIVSKTSTVEDKILLKKLQSIVSSPGIGNKMFVKAEYMPHKIQITDVKLERLQDISDEDCLKEGIIDFCSIPKQYAYKENGNNYCIYNTPRKAFASLIDKVSGKGTWNENPWVVVYYYELVK